MNRLKNIHQKNQPKRRQKKQRAPHPNAMIHEHCIAFAVQHHNAGRVQQAEALYQQVLNENPKHPTALHLLGVLARDVGQHEVAIKLIKKAIVAQPEFPEAHNNLAVTYKKLGRLDDALMHYRKAVAIDPDNAVAQYNLGNTLKDLGLLDEAVDHYQKATCINPDFAEAKNNTADCLKQLGDFDGAVQVLEIAVKKHPNQIHLNSSLVTLLNSHIPKERDVGPHAKAQNQLQKLSLKDANASPITDEAVSNLYQSSYDIIEAHNVNPTVLMTQIWRGMTIDQGCERHMRVFNTYNVVPEYCFSCYKVTIDVPTVLELFKLMIVFDTIELTNDNTRKCLVETRAEISGAYKGLVYCQSLDEAADIVALLKPLLRKKISDHANVAIRRGCSEFKVAYPKFGEAEPGKQPAMTYDALWREYEDVIDHNQSRYLAPLLFESQNHDGLTLYDVIVMRYWLSYAATIGDLSGRIISQEDLAHLDIKNRLPFKLTDS